MRIKRFNENQDTFRPLKVEDERVYYKLHVDNSIRKFEIILDKLGIKKWLFREYGYDIENYRKYIENNSVIYLLIDFFDSDVKKNDSQIEIITDENLMNHLKNREDFLREYGGEVFATK